MKKMRTAAPSRTYGLFVRAMKARKQIPCVYDGYPRELCPIILGHAKGQEKALTYQLPAEVRSPYRPRAIGKVSSCRR
jgi:hypothetical protein